MKRTTEIQNKIKFLIESKSEQLQAIETEIEKAQAEKDMNAATEALNTKAYTKAKERISAAETAIEMYSARRKQVRGLEYVTEQESDAVIDSLLEDKFLNDIKAPLEHLAALLKGYTGCDLSCRLREFLDREQIKI